MRNVAGRSADSYILNICSSYFVASVKRPVSVYR